MTTTETRTRLAPRRAGTRVGAVDEYAALQRAAIDRMVHHGLEAAGAALRLHAGSEHLVAESGLPRDEASVLVRPFVEATEAAIAELTAELHHMTAHVLRMARARLGLC